MKNNEILKNLVYDGMSGLLDDNCYQTTELKLVQDEFVDGLFCEQAYEEVFLANQRLCQRLGVQADKDVESIIDNLLAISRHLALKMYDYGVRFSSVPSK